MLSSHNKFISVNDQSDDDMFDFEESISENIDLPVSVDYSEVKIMPMASVAADFLLRGLDIKGLQAIEQYIRLASEMKQDEVQGLEKIFTYDAFALLSEALRAANALSTHELEILRDDDASDLSMDIRAVVSEYAYSRGQIAVYYVPSDESDLKSFQGYTFYGMDSEFSEKLVGSYSDLLQKMQQIFFGSQSAWIVELLKRSLKSGSDDNLITLFNNPFYFGNFGEFAPSDLMEVMLRKQVKNTKVGGCIFSEFPPGEEGRLAKIDSLVSSPCFVLVTSGARNSGLLPVSYTVSGEKPYVFVDDVPLKEALVEPLAPGVVVPISDDPENPYYYKANWRYYHDSDSARDAWPLFLDWIIDYEKLKLENETLYKSDPAFKEKLDLSMIAALDELIELDFDPVHPVIHSPNLNVNIRNLGNDSNIIYSVSLSSMINKLSDYRRLNYKFYVLDTSSSFVLMQHKDLDDLDSAPLKSVPGQMYGFDASKAVLVSLALRMANNFLLSYTINMIAGGDPLPFYDVENFFKMNLKQFVNANRRRIAKSLAGKVKMNDPVKTLMKLVFIFIQMNRSVWGGIAFCAKDTKMGRSRSDYVQEDLLDVEDFIIGDDNDEGVFDF